VNTSTLVQKLWNYCNVLRDDGMSYGDYVEQATYLLFLKMADEQYFTPRALIQAMVDCIASLRTSTSRPNIGRTIRTSSAGWRCRPRGGHRNPARGRPEGRNGRTQCARGLLRSVLEGVDSRVR
jgi:hypothetical protein